MNLRRTYAMTRKEFLHIVRDPRSLVMALAVPLVMLLLFGYGLTLDVDRIPTLIYDMDSSPESREAIARFAGSRFFDVLGSVDGYRAIEREIDRDKALLAVVIPQDFSRELLSGRQPQVQLIFDGSDSNTASIAKGYAEALLQNYAYDVRARALDQKGGGRMEAPVDARLRVLYNSELKSRNYLVPGLIATILAIITALLTSLTIAREWETGTMEQLLSTPVRPAEVVLGKMLAFFALGFIDTLMAVAVGVLVFGVPLRGNPLLLIGATSIFLFGSLCWGILISAAARTQVQAYQLGMLSSFLPALLLSGFVYSIENMPAVIQLISYIVPARYIVTVLKGVFLKGVGLEILWGQVALLVVYGAAAFVVATRKLRQKVA
ncbi:MAG TPA: ABC transporter permease [Bryobacteraceae bacterium]|nr:ABC transporter permease [Bryobacteraceae bacterium]HOQ46471.1 ABC transporter permease [Bryobacteraceae bacterium]HPQ15105.1 ABC transporter permease [Bryobacteraceae bacterium]HPU72630.1 ABC transporter permease [Bryobacteraceae bacterium]